MAQNVGTLELKEGAGAEGAIVTALMGSINVAGLIAGGIAIAENPNAPEGAKMTHTVKIRSAGQWASLGKARFLRKNDKSAHYMEMVLESPMIDAKIGKELWLRAFPPSGSNMGDRPDAEQYEIVWGNGKKQVGGGDVLADDVIPF